MGQVWSGRIQERDTHKAVQGSVRLVIDTAALLLAGLDGGIDQALIPGVVCRSEDERRVGRRILGLVDIDSCPMRTYKSVAFPNEE